MVFDSKRFVSRHICVFYEEEKIRVRYLCIWGGGGDSLLKIVFLFLGGGGGVSESCCGFDVFDLDRGLNSSPHFDSPRVHCYFLSSVTPQILPFLVFIRVPRRLADRGLF